MILNKLTDCLNKKEVYGKLNIEISFITANSKNAGKDSLFIAVPGTNIDGHDFLNDAFNNGARVFITERSFKQSGTTNIVVPDCRAALAKLTAEFYNHPSKAMTLIGITGTNGKTTTAFLIESILKETKSRVGLLSTIQYRFGTQTLAASHTTPGPLELQKVLRDMADTGTQYAVMEVSSHGLQQKRVENCHFDTVIFTNLTPEHLDYHKTMDAYLKAKEILFTSLLSQSDKKDPVAVINTDDPSAQTLLNKIKRGTITYGINSGDIHTENIDMSLDGIKADIVTPEKIFSVRSKLIGHFNIYNILAAVSAAVSLGLSTEEIKAGIEKAKNIPGRMDEVRNDKGIKIFIDYAHTGDALKNVLKTINELTDRKIITIFGCGGDRDREKRPVMGKIAANYSNILFVTSDNPRTEDPNIIIKEIEVGVMEKNFIKKDKPSSTADTDKIYFIEENRSIAIKEGISIAKPGDVVLIAGKGHETYQISGNNKYHFDDREEAMRALKLCA
jgi:UDP-N-acetylmuramoyl-L-alanyl-D-glutamate--2,6-diaminopimelate ligase